MSAAEKKKYIKELQKQGMSPSQARKMCNLQNELSKSKEQRKGG